MGAWNLNTLRFGGDCTPQSSPDKVIGSLGNTTQTLRPTVDGSEIRRENPPFGCQTTL